MGERAHLFSSIRGKGRKRGKLLKEGKSGLYPLFTTREREKRGGEVRRKVFPDLPKKEKKKKRKGEGGGKKVLYRVLVQGGEEKSFVYLPVITRGERKRGEERSKKRKDEKKDPSRFIPERRERGERERKTSRRDGLLSLLPTGGRASSSLSDPSARKKKGIGGRI